MRGVGKKIVMAVHSTFGGRNTFGMRAWYVADAASKDYSLAVLARSTSGVGTDRFEVSSLGLGRKTALVLKRLRSLLPAGILLPSAQEYMERSATRYFEGRDPREVALFHSWPYLPKTYAYVKSKNPDCRIIQDISMTPNPGDTLFAVTAPFVDTFTVPSEYVRAAVLAFGVPERKLRLVPFGVDCSAFRPPASRNHRGTFRVAFAGKLERRKGIFHLLEAWETLDLKDAELHLYGRASEEARRRLRRTANRGIFSHGFVNLPQELAKNLLFVLPSRQEGSAKAIYEALACGLPTITTPNAGSVVQDGEEGFLIEPERPDMIAEKLLFYYLDRDALALASAKARAKALAYTWERYAASVLSIYAE